MLTIVIPVRDGGAAFERCLEALEAARDATECELIVVDDGSDARALANGARVLHTAGGAGPAAARNLGARAARGDVLFFADADVAVRPDTLARVAAAFAREPDLAACFGSYDDAPGDAGFLSQYKNLFHHYVHQHAGEQATTFWTGCGAIRRALFLELGGFDEQAYRRPSIEDIDLGYRLLRRFPNARIRLLKDLQVKHLKRWTPGALLRSDIVDRGVPWTRLLWREKLHPAGTGANTRDLNLQMSNRISVVLIWALLAGAAAGVLAVAAPFPPAMPAWAGAAACALALLALNRGLYAFYARVRGWPFALAVIPWHWLYYAYNLVSFALGTLLFARDWLAHGAGLFAGEPRNAPD
jgi:glycosyltransferase involved in cell wall biosynthesis